MGELKKNTRSCLGFVLQRRRGSHADQETARAVALYQSAPYRDRGFTVFRRDEGRVEPQIQIWDSSPRERSRRARLYPPLAAPRPGIGSRQTAGRERRDAEPFREGSIFTNGDSR